tara:strand:+ start:130 stop:573 length:444 start_codon:yes stop_codon:yes gene_type:complete
MSDENQSQLEKVENVDPLAEMALESLYEGASIEQIAKKGNVCKRTVLSHLSKGGYADRYARAMVSKGMLLADEVVTIPDDLPDDPTPGELAKAKMRMEARQWLGTKFWQHLRPETIATGLMTQVQGSTPSIVINVASPKEKIVNIEE